MSRRLLAPHQITRSHSTTGGKNPIQNHLNARPEALGLLVHQPRRQIGVAGAGEQRQACSEG